jgi:Na+(H+)/acetate symporter ActP
MRKVVYGRSLWKRKRRNGGVAGMRAGMAHQLELIFGNGVVSIGIDGH